MRLFTRLLATVRGVFRPGALDDDVADELRFHLDRQIQANLIAGMSRDEATRAAHLHTRKRGAPDPFAFATRLLPR